MIASKVFLEGIPKAQRSEILDTLCYTFPVWFFEVLVEFGSGPLVLEPFQIKTLTNIDAPYLIVNKSRQSGGSLIFALEQMYRAITTYDYRCDIISLNLNEATDKIRYIRNAWETLPMRYQPKLFKDNALSIGFHDGRRSSTINSLAPTSAVRGGKKSLLLDEYAHVHPARQDQIYTAALPAMMNSTPGQELTIRIVSTPLGDSNKFAQIWYNKEQANGKRMYDDFVRQQFIWLDVKRFFNTEEEFNAVQHDWYVTHNQDLSKMDELVAKYGNDAIQRIRAASSQEDFLQEMCGSFVSYRDQFFTNELISKCCKSNITADALRHMNIDEEVDVGDLSQELGFEAWTERPKHVEGEVIMGIDFGESTPDKDKTVIQVMQRDKKGNYYQRACISLNGYEWGDFVKQADFIAEVHKKFRPDKVIVDGTALGRGVSDIIESKVPNIRLEEVIFTNQTKDEMMTNLRLLMEGGKLFIQEDDKNTQRELRNIQRQETRAGTIRYFGNPHDDRVMALALAVKNSVYRPFAIYMIG